MLPAISHIHFSLFCCGNVDFLMIIMRKSQAPSYRAKSALYMSSTVTADASISTSLLEANQVRTTENILSSLSTVKNPPEHNQYTSTVINTSDVTNVKEDKASVLEERTFNICYGKPSKKKHKTWDGEGVIIVGEKLLTIKDEEGKIIGTAPRWKCRTPAVGTKLFIGNKEIELIDEVLEAIPNALKRKPEVAEPPVMKRPKGLETIALVPQSDNERLRAVENISSAVAADAAISINLIKANQIRSTENILSLLSTAHNTPEHNQCTSSDIFAHDVPSLKDEKASVLVERKFNVCYGKPSKKKHKTWDGDGILIMGEKLVTVKDEEGKIIGTAPRWKCKQPAPGTRLFIGNKEIELIDELLEGIPSEMKRKPEVAEPPVIKRPKGLGTRALVLQAENERLILPEPSAEHQWNFSNNDPLTPVVVDPLLARKLRPHQRKGVSFMYECVMGFKDNAISGAILADEMGLGKTLQCIALIWTLLKQGPYGKPVVRRVLIVTPSSLTGNWATEFKKWLGIGRLTPYVIDARHKPQDRHPNERVVIISYEMLQRHRTAVGGDFNLLICDEAHRLKNADTKVSQALNELCISMRILLTGTPMQNDLQEFFALVDFANPNCVGSYSSFRKQYEDLILAARQPEATEEVRQLGEERALELNQLTGVFILRRTQSVLDSYLPGKKEVVVYCRASPLQQAVYNAVLRSLGNLSSGLDGAFHLGVIAALRKVASHPALLIGENCVEDQHLGAATSQAAAAEAAKAAYSDEELTLTKHSGKLLVLAHFLSALWRSSPRERVVLVSAFTQTLDMLEELCKVQQYPTLRLDGSTPSNQRIGIVTRFNSDASQFVFLLSAKAGGVGLNLVGASRLVLFDSDWNPATDLQAMARIWRDGQRRQVFIYRLLTTGTIEEKMFMRQLSKQTLAGGIVDSLSSNSVLLSQDDLKDIFASCENVQDCWTHASLACVCDGSGMVPEPLVSKENRPCQMLSSTTAITGALRMEELMSWEHHRPPINQNALVDLKLDECVEFITYMFSTSCS